MDLDDQELWYTQFKKGLFKERDLEQMQKQYKQNIMEHKGDTQDWIRRLKLIEKKLEDYER